MIPAVESAATITTTAATMALELALILTEAACECFLAWRLGVVS